MFFLDTPFDLDTIGQIVTKINTQIQHRKIQQNQT
jgi:hypothetical protein